jgi:hypothetical protein
MMKTLYARSGACSSGGSPWGRSFGQLARCAAILLVAGLAAGCSSNQRAQEDTAGPRPGPQREYDPNRDASVFGDEGFSIGTLKSGRTGGILGEEEKGRLPVNKYLWQGALDTLSFLPLSSTDPFTGVIATDWGATPEAPGERFKVTAFIVSPVLSAASLKVAVYREARNADGLWVPAPVSPDTARKLEDAILTRARQIRIADLGEGTSG